VQGVGEKRPAQRKKKIAAEATRRGLNGDDPPKTSLGTKRRTKNSLGNHYTEGSAGGL